MSPVCDEASPISSALFVAGKDRDHIGGNVGPSSLADIHGQLIESHMCRHRGFGQTSGCLGPPRSKPHAHRASTAPAPSPCSIPHSPYRPPNRGTFWMRVHRSEVFPFFPIHMFACAPFAKGIAGATAPGLPGFNALNKADGVHCAPTASNRHCCALPQPPAAVFDHRHMSANHQPQSVNHLLEFYRPP